MKETLHCDINHMAQTIEKVQNDNEYERIDVMDTDCVMRGITLDEMRERNIHDLTQIAIIEAGVSRTYKFKFHQSQIDNGVEFSFRPPGPKEIDPDYCVAPSELGENLSDVEKELDNIFRDITWDFAKVEAASFANGGHLTDFEFEYDLVVIS